MFSVYAVKIKNGKKDRFYVGTYESLDEAKHVANCYTLGTADYAYIKDLTDSVTVFFIRNLAYDERLPDPGAPVPQFRAL